MKMHVLEREQTLPISPEEAWAFFSAPHNLDAITPPDAGFRLLTGSDESLHDGQILTYRILLAPLVEVSWVTEIKSVEPGPSSLKIILIVKPVYDTQHLHGARNREIPTEEIASPNQCPG